jgi:hypothetical protein
LLARQILPISKWFKEFAALSRHAPRGFFFVLNVNDSRAPHFPFFTLSCLRFKAARDLSSSIFFFIRAYAGPFAYSHTVVTAFVFLSAFFSFSSLYPAVLKII